MTKSGKYRKSSISDIARFEDSVYAYSIEGPAKKSPRSGDQLRDTLETLYSEHRYIASLLDNLEQQAERLKPGKIPDYHLLHEMVDYLIHYPSQYHHPREDLLFIQMLDSDKDFQACLDRLHREHETLGQLTRELFNDLTLAVDGRPVDRPELRRFIVNYIDGYRRHMEFESTEVFPRAKGSLTAQDVKRLNMNTRYVDDPLFGGELQYRFRRLRRDMQARMDIAGQQLVVRELRGIESGIERIARCVETLGRYRDQLVGRGKRQQRR